MTYSVKVTKGQNSPEVVCPKCNSKFHVPTELGIPRTFNCPKCHEELAIEQVRELPSLVPPAPDAPLSHPEWLPDGIAPEKEDEEQPKKPGKIGFDF